MPIATKELWWKQLCDRFGVPKDFQLDGIRAKELFSAEDIISLLVSAGHPQAAVQEEALALIEEPVPLAADAFARIYELLDEVVNLLKTETDSSSLDWIVYGVAAYSGRAGKSASRAEQGLIVAFGQTENETVRQKILWAISQFASGAATTKEWLMSLKSSHPRTQRLINAALHCS